MAKKHNRRKIPAKSRRLSNTNYLMGSSADTSTDSPNNTPNLNSSFNIKHHNFHHSSNPIHVRRGDSLKYAILNDDILEEGAMLSSSEGYDASSNNSSANSQSLMAEDQPLDEFIQNSLSQGNYSSIHYQDSVFSEISDSILLLQDREHHNSLKWYRRPSIFMVSVLVFSYCFSLGIAMSSDLDLIMKAVCYLVNGEVNNCSTPSVQQMNANLQKYNNFIGSFIKILVSVKMGKLSDIYGRKPMFLITFTLSCLSKFMCVFILTPRYFTFNRVILANIVDSFGGSIFVLLSIANSYVCDVVHERERLPALSKVTGAFFLGLSLGPLTSSFLGSTFNIPSIHFVGASAALFFMSIIFVIWCIPESRGEKLRDKSRRFSIRSRRELESSPSWTYKLGLSGVIDSFESLKILWITRPRQFSTNENNSEYEMNPSQDPSSLQKLEIDLPARVNGILLLAIDLFFVICSAGSSLPIALYMIYKFNLSQSQLGLFVGVISGSRAIVLSVLNPWVQHNLLNFFSHDPFNVDFIDITTIGVAILSEIVASLLCSISPTLWILCFYFILTSLSAVGSPVIHSALLKYNPNPSKNGEFFGALALIKNIVNLVAPWFFLTVYSFGIGIAKPEIIFYIILGSFSIAGLLLGNIRVKN